MKIAPKMLALATVFMLGWKICAIECAVYRNALQNGGSARANVMLRRHVLIRLKTGLFSSGFVF